MTIHIHIDDQEAERQLTIMAKQQNKTIEQQAKELLVNTLRERDIKLQKLRKKLAVGEAQLDRGEYADYSLKKVITELDKEEKQEDQVNNGRI